jgi:hypothetical protein
MLVPFIAVSDDARDAMSKSGLVHERRFSLSFWIGPDEFASGSRSSLPANPFGAALGFLSSVDTGEIKVVVILIHYIPNII